ncbi:DUF333 domain-containing protein [Caballeronia sp. GAFFF2]|uniref:putative hemolysin n=1 Tax=Caballeronia sp. GAFFF2 TaxID=2921741 RepID=UPI0032ED05F8
MFKLLTALFAGVFMLTACAQASSSAAGATVDQPASRIGLANPASVNCTRQGGTLQIVDTVNGQVGMCHFPGGQSCEEWALLRGQCSPGQK